MNAPHAHLAVADLGSNSFRLEIASAQSGHIERIDYLKESVRLGAGINDAGELSPGAMAQAWECLERFGERLRGFRPDQVRIIATQTLRQATNAKAFIIEGNRRLGYPISVVPGIEEARLIYQGVAHLLPLDDRSRLVIDIGGRSTEFAIGVGYVASGVASLPMGSVSCSKAFFADGQLKSKSFQAARTAISTKVESLPESIKQAQWSVVYGASGTINAVTEILGGMQLSFQPITRDHIESLIAKLIKFGRTENIEFVGLKSHRKEVIAGGISALLGVMDALRIEEIYPAQGALRQGAFYDLLDRENRNTDVRERTIQSLQLRLSVDLAQANRVALVADQLFQSVAVANHRDKRFSRKLHWSAMVHEIGAVVNHTNAPRHSAYILQNIEAPGFSMEELQRLSDLVRAQKGRLKKFADLIIDELFAKQLFSLRVAILFCNARVDPDVSKVSATYQDKVFRLHIPPMWAAAHPNTMFLLTEECSQWDKSGYTLNIDIH